MDWTPIASEAVLIEQFKIEIISEGLNLFFKMTDGNITCFSIPSQKLSIPNIDYQAINTKKRLFSESNENMSPTDTEDENSDSPTKDSELDPLKKKPFSSNFPPIPQKAVCTNTSFYHTINLVFFRTTLVLSLMFAVRFRRRKI